MSRNGIVFIKNILGVANILHQISNSNYQPISFVLNFLWLKIGLNALS